MSVEQQATRVASGAKSALKALIQKLGGTVSDTTKIDGYADIIGAMTLSEMKPSSHASTHKTGGSDAIAPADIGAAASSHTHIKANITDFPTSMTPTAHKATHKTGGSDAIAPADIGAAAASHTHAASEITSGTLPIARGGTGASNTSSALSNLGAQAMAKTLTLSLTATGWSATSKIQTCVATGVTASNIVIVSPAPTSQDAYAAAGIKCTAQGASSLTFSCETVPAKALSVNVVIL